MRPIRTLTLVLALVLTLAACGDDDATGPGDLGSTSSTAAVTTTTGAGSGTVSTIGNIPGVSGECEAYVNLSLAMSQVFTGGFTEFDQSIVSGLPAAAQADGAIIVNALAQYGAALAEAGIDFSNPAAMATMDPAQLQAFSDLIDQIFTDDVQAAFDRLGETMSAECDTSLQG